MHPHNTLAYDPQGDSATLNFYAHLWKPFIPQDQIPQFKIHGSFVREIVPGKLLGISFNTMYLFNSNPFADRCGAGTGSPGDVVLHWFEKVLQDARTRSLSVYVSGHVPPNINNYVPSCYYAFSTLCQKYDDVIQGQYYGHMNIDHFYFPVVNEFPVFENDKITRADGLTMNGLSPFLASANEDHRIRLMPSWIAQYFQTLLLHYKYVSKEVERIPTPIFVSPSVVPAFNPALRVYKYHTLSDLQDSPQDLSFGALLDYDQYFANLEKWNAAWEGEFIFELEYTPRSAYEFKEKNITTSAWVDLAKRLVRGRKKHFLDSTRKHKKKKKKQPIEDPEILLRKYLSYMVVGIDVNSVSR